MPEHQILTERATSEAAENGVHANGTNGVASNGVTSNGIEIKPRADDHAHRNGSSTAPPVPATPEVEANYQYWRDNGAEWADGYDYRKKRQVLYHIQELMLTQYIQQHASTA